MKTIVFIFILFLNSVILENLSSKIITPKIWKEKRIDIEAEQKNIKDHDNQIINNFYIEEIIECINNFLDICVVPKGITSFSKTAITSLTIDKQFGQYFFPQLKYIKFDLSQFQIIWNYFKSYRFTIQFSDREECGPDCYFFVIKADNIE